MFFRNLELNVNKENEFSNHIQMINGNLKSLMFEIDTDYFHIVDESRLFLKNLMPLRGVRFKEKGMKIILDKFSNIFQKDLKVKTFKLDLDKYNLSGSEVEEILEKNENFYKELNFKKLKKNEFSCILVNIINREEKLMHASTFVYGLDEKNEKYIIFVDPYFYSFADVIDSGCFISCMISYFYTKIKNIKVYAQAEKIQRDSNSCSTISLEAIRKFCSKDLVGKIINQKSKENIKKFKKGGRDIFFIKYKLPEEIKCLKQKLTEEEDILGNVIKIQENEINFFNKYKRYHQELMINDYKVKMVTQFNRWNKIYDDLSCFKLKKINTLPLLRSYWYVKHIVNILKKQYNEEIKDYITNKPIQFNPNYWVDQILNPDDIKFNPRKMMKVKRFKGQEEGLEGLTIKEEREIRIFV